MLIFTESDVTVGIVTGGWLLQNPLKLLLAGTPLHLSQVEVA